MSLNQDPDLRASCRMCLTANQVNKPHLVILQDDSLNRPLPPNLPTSPNKEDTGSATIIFPYKPQDPSALSSAAHTRGRTPYHLAAPPESGLHLLREVVNGKMGTIKVHVPFTMADLTQRKQQLECYSKNSSQSMEGFQQLSITFDLTWQDLYIILTHCCTSEEKNCIWARPQEFADELAAKDRDHYLVGGH